MGAQYADLRRLAADLGQASTEVTDRAREVVSETAYHIEATAKQFAPVRTGALKASIGVDIHGGGLSADIGSDLRYAIFQEEGTSKMAPRSYLGPALDRHSPEFAQDMEAVGADVLKWV